MKIKKIHVIAMVALLVLIAGGALFMLRGSTSAAAKLDPTVIVMDNGLGKLGKDIVFSNGASNLTLVISKDEATLIDTGYTTEDAKGIKDYIDKNNLKLKYLILTHMHSDHTGNYAAFNTDGVQVYKPSNVKDGDTITMGDKTFKFISSPGHVPGNAHISVELVKEHVLVAGDVVITDCIPALGGSVNEMLITLNKIKDSSYNVIIPGHGKVVDSELAIDRNIEYINNAKSLITELINKQEQSPDLANIKLEDCVTDTSYIDADNIQQLHLFALNNLFTQLKKELNK